MAVADPLGVLQAVIFEDDDGWAAALCEYGQPHLMTWVKGEFADDRAAEQAVRAVKARAGVKVVYRWAQDIEVFSHARRELEERQIMAGIGLFGQDD